MLSVSSLFGTGADFCFSTASVLGATGCTGSDFSALAFTVGSAAGEVTFGFGGSSGSGSGKAFIISFTL